jgi:hypothetical protein
MFLIGVVKVWNRNMYIISEEMLVVLFFGRDKFFITIFRAGVL